MSSPGTTKQEEGVRLLLEDSFSNPRSRSPSQSPQVLASMMSSIPTGSDQGNLQIESPNVAATRHSYESTGGLSDIPSVVATIELRPKEAQPTPNEGGSVQVDSTATRPTSNLVPRNLLESSGGASGIPTPLQPTNTKASQAALVDIPDSTASSHEVNTLGPMTLAAIPPNQGQRSLNLAWGGLRRALSLLRDSSNMFSHLSSVIESLLVCLDRFELLTHHRPCFEELATELATLCESLKQYMLASPSALMSDSILSLTLAVGREVIEIENRLDRMTGGILDINVDDEVLARCCHKIQLYSRQLQTNASMSTWSIANEHLVVREYHATTSNRQSLAATQDTRLEDLNPAKQATYDSSLSTQINRRGCTEGTRTGVLDGLDEWLYGPTSSSIYWMNGMAGTGKTTIASTFCERAEGRKLLAASFFCTRSSAECRNVARIAPTIAYQLARYSIPFQSALCQALEQTPDIGSKNVLKQFEQLIKEPMLRVKDAVPDNLVVVIDALDECEDRNRVELVLDMLFRHTAGLPLKFLITSRPEPEIYTKMSAYARSREVLHLHDIEKSLVRADIELYLKQELEFMSPSASRADIEKLAQRSGTLFIYAATLVKYIRPGKRSADPHKRLRSILNMTVESTKKHTQIDALYTAVLKSALSNDESGAGETEDIQVVLPTVLFAQEPISVETIAELAKIDDPRRVINALHPLRSVLHQSEETRLVSTLHASFPDFMFSRERSGIYFYDILEHSQTLARRCFSVMAEQLRFNICGLSSSFVPDRDVENLKGRVKANISPTLSYACRYWARHLALAPQSNMLLTLLEEFLSHRLLFWMEVLNLQREMLTGVDELLTARQWSMHANPSPSELMLLIDDARGFVSGFNFSPASQSTPHIYISCLPFSSPSNLVYHRYHTHTQGLLKLTGDLMRVREAAPLATWRVGSIITSLALSPDGTRVAIGGNSDGATLTILSTSDTTIHVGPLWGHADNITAIEFSLDGSRVVSASTGCIRVWNAYNGTLINDSFMGRLGSIRSVGFSPDGTRVVSGGLTVQIWSVFDGTPVLDVATQLQADRVRCIKFSPDGALVAFPSVEHEIHLWNSQDGTPAVSPLKGHTGRIDCLAFTPDSSRLVSGAIDNTIRVWNIIDGSLIITSSGGSLGSVKFLTVSPDGARIVGATDNAVLVRKIDDGELIAGPFYGADGIIPSNSLAYAPDGTRVFTGYSNGTIRVWNVRDGMFPPPPLPSQDVLRGIKAMTFCPDNLHFLSSHGNGTLLIWNTSDGSFTTSPHKLNIIPSPITTLSHGGIFVAGETEHGRLQVADTVNGSLVAGPFEVECDSLSAFQFSRNNKGIIMGFLDGTIKVCPLASGNTVVGSLKGHHKRVSALAESSDCSTLVSFSDYEMVFRIWNLDTPALDLKLSNAVTKPVSEQQYTAIYEGWNINEDGWVVNNRQHLLFWLPPDIASAWCSPYATLVITKTGTLKVPKQKLFIGNEWTRCYVSD